jgi:hypothetical protein
MFERLDAMSMSAWDREMAKDYLRKSDALVEFAYRAWKRIRDIASGPRTGAAKVDRDSQMLGNGGD